MLGVVDARLNVLVVHETLERARLAKRKVGARDDSTSDATTLELVKRLKKQLDATQLHEGDNEPELISLTKRTELVKQARQYRDALVHVVVDELRLISATRRYVRVQKAGG